MQHSPRRAPLLAHLAPYAALTEIRTRDDQLFLFRQGDDRPVELRAEGGEDLRKMINAGDYRATGLTLEDVRHALDDTSAPPDRRIGAALLPRTAGAPEAQDLIRVAADTTADDELRAALEHAAEDELDGASPARTGR
ncbi:hypothetical protein [Sorangium sp. So ce542]|uniref:hypothetical protein n=1 Tax=Sorangium sp. So ce542 TaxID=3133316 RepID=UPI003F5E4604